MPRAKRTDRAEARRRHRASLGLPPSEEAERTAPSPPPGRATAPPRSAGTPAERPGLGYAFRAAFRPLNLREDLAALPALLVNRAVWLPCLITVLAGVAFVVTDGSSWLVAIIATYFVAPPALGSVFLGGFLAPRASYLVGLIVGFVSAAVAAVIILTSPTSLVTGQPLVTAPTAPPVASGPASPGASAASPGASAASPDAAASGAPSASSTPSASPAPTPASTQDQIIYAFVTSPPFGMFFAAAAAWYRRFLRLSNPNRGRPQQPRRSDGKSRSNPNQKPRG